MWVVAFGDLAIAAAAVVVVIRFGTANDHITEVVAVLTSAFTAISTMTTAYFGIRAATNTAQSAVTGAGEQVRSAMAGQSRQGLPSVTALSPNEGPPGGGTEVTITGSGFTPDAVVRFGTTMANSKLESNTRITAVSPVRTPGEVTVTVETAGGTSPSAVGATFTYK